ncbi:sugar O-acetyltransferase [Natronococcus occultus]|uniref:Acetyltransferase (Isoleucine patch superfamily) n=1 Tax=Natronococcus occultus SP4 TaxID=694430 RepID=L0K4I5_9EURY|nr:sugar O-acetyltransferase [Natronococcus occultus]AGB39460.1 acetyltransferase (isoleucine patch superfamily) [Natronococcus occultus SP4]
MASEREKMLAGEAYDPSDPELAAARERAGALCRLYNRTTASDRESRELVLQELFGAVGEGPQVEPPFRCDYGDQIAVGDEFFANFGCVVLDVRSVTVGDRCLLGPGVHVYTATHPLEAAARAEGVEYGDPVSVGDDVWIGGQAVLNPGVSVGDRSVVASGAVVTRDVPADVVVAGNPAEVVRELD